VRSASLARSAGTGVAAILLIALMAIGSVVMWLGVPVGWLYLASRIADSSRPSMGIYVLVLVGIPATMVLVGKALATLDRTYARVTHEDRDTRVQRPWMKSMRGERGSGHKRTVLDRVMFISVSIALVCFGIWFFGFAGSSLPGA